MTLFILYTLIQMQWLAEQAVKAALSDYYRRQGIDPEPIVGKLEEDCDHCSGESCKV